MKLFIVRAAGSTDPARLVVEQIGGPLLESDFQEDAHTLFTLLNECIPGRTFDLLIQRINKETAFWKDVLTESSNNGNRKET